MADEPLALKYQIEELRTIYWEREQFLQGKIQRQKISDIEAGLARFRLGRLAVCIKTLESLAQDAPQRVEALPATEQPAEAPKALASAPAATTEREGDGWDDE